MSANEYDISSNRDVYTPLLDSISTPPHNTTTPVMDSKHALPFILGAAAAGLMGTYLGFQLATSAGPPSHVVPAVGAANPKTPCDGESTKPSPTPPQVSPQFSSAKTGNGNAGTSKASPSSPTRLFAELQEIYDPRRGWIVAPPPIDNANGRDTKARAFVVHFREAPSGRSAENSIWLEVENDALLEKLREHFPTAVGLYDNKPGVSTHLA